MTTLGLNSIPDMLISNGAGGFIAGPYDLIGVMKDTSTGRYHAALWEEKPLPGGGPPTVVRLKSKLHHTEGAETFEGALEHVRAMLEKITIDDCNVWATPDQIVERNFATEGFADVWALPKWR